jgi:hypothetical protein
MTTIEQYELMARHGVRLIRKRDGLHATISQVGSGRLELADSDGCLLGIPGGRSSSWWDPAEVAEHFDVEVTA